MALVALGLGCFLLRNGHERLIKPKGPFSFVKLPCVKSLISLQRRTVVTSETSELAESTTPTLGRLPFVSQQSELSYSQLLEKIRNGDISALELVPARREVVATFPDGTQRSVSIFLNDQQILRAAESSATPLTVKDIRQEQAMAGLLGNIGLILIQF